MNNIYDRVQKDQEGNDVWIYDYNLLKNPTMFIIVLKAFALAFLFPYFLVVLLSVIDGDFNLDRFVNISKGFLIIYTFLILLITFSYYLIYIPLKGKSYLIIYKMNEKDITFIEHRDKKNKMNALQKVGVIVGTLSGNPTLAGSNLLAMSHSSLTSRFSRVRKIIIYNNHIKLRGSDMVHNHIWFHQDDKDYIINVLSSKCTKAKVITR